MTLSAASVDVTAEIASRHRPTMPRPRANSERTSTHWRKGGHFVRYRAAHVRLFSTASSTARGAEVRFVAEDRFAFRNARRGAHLAKEYGYTCARRADGTATCWGAGDGTKTQHLTPSEIVGL